MSDHFHPLIHQPSSHMAMRTIHQIIESILKVCCDTSNEWSQFATSTEVMNVVCRTVEVLETEPSVVKLTGKVIVVGDIHGDLKSLVRIFDTLGYPDSRRFVFLGDYIDRGHYSCEVLILLYSLKILYPTNLYLLRGNHEIDFMTEHYGFRRECLSRFLPNVYSRIVDSFCHFPVCGIINNRIICVHGGLIPNLSISNINKGIEDILWSDPRSEVTGFVKSDRGQSYYFGRDAVDDFLKREGYEFLIRSHEDCCKGYSWPFGSETRCLTIFSSINYCNEMNDGAVCIFNELNEREIYQFSYESTKLHWHPLIPSFILQSFQFHQIDWNESQLDFDVNLLI
jgi:diadenosine tetraphosphatase ApaH/serine/threonine PP2A family protein phosphatase